MTLLSELIGRETLGLGTATSAGTVTAIGLDKNHITLVEAARRMISSSAVRSYDGDVLTFDEQAPPPQVGSRRPTDPRGSRVIDQHGNGLGEIEDMTISADGVIEVITLTSHDTVLGARLLAIGEYAAIVSLDP